MQMTKDEIWQLKRITKLEETLPTNILKLWYQHKIDVIKPAPVNLAMAKHPFLKSRPPKATADWSTATVFMRLVALTTYILAAVEIDLDWMSDLNELASPAIVEKLLAGPLSRLSAVTRGKDLCHLQMFVQRLTGSHKPWLGLAARRIEAEDGQRDLRARLQSQDKLRGAAVTIADRFLGQALKTPRDCVAIRHAAIIGITADISPRTGELADIFVGDVRARDPARQLFFDADNSKMQRSQIRGLSEPVKYIVQRYVEEARPLLLGPNNEDNPWLWVSERGEQMTHRAVAASLGVPLEQVTGVKGSFNLGRQAAASNPDIRESDAYRGLNDVPGSSSVDENYRFRSRLEGVSAMQEIVAMHAKGAKPS